MCNTKMTVPSLPSHLKLWIFFSVFYQSQKNMVSGLAYMKRDHHSGERTTVKSHKATVDIMAEAA